jgi:hypothetical protein
MRVVTKDEAVPRGVKLWDDGSRSEKTNYFGVSGKHLEGPQAFLMEFWPGEGGQIRAHFHHVRQFQIFVRGDDIRIGKHPVAPISYHYADADSPYGPIVPAKDGVAFYTLRPQSATGAYRMPGQKNEMGGRARRNIAGGVSTRSGDGGSQEVLIERHEDGLAASALRLAPNEITSSLDPSGSGGQYVLVCDGSLRYEGRDIPAESLIWIDADEGPVTIAAGDDGAMVLVLQVPCADAYEDVGLAKERLAAAT